MSFTPTHLRNLTNAELLLVVPQDIPEVAELCRRLAEVERRVSLFSMAFEGMKEKGYFKDPRGGK